LESLLENRKAFAYTAAHAPDPRKPTVVFMHGAGLDHSWFGLQSRYFGYHGWNVLAVDLPGHGRSAGPPIPTIGAMAEWIFKLVAAPRLSIVGHSMGALVAVECAARQPDRVERIALIGVAYPMKVNEAFLDAARRDHLDAFDMETIWGHAPRVPLGGNPNPGMWMYGDTLARLRRLAPGRPQGLQRLRAPGRGEVPGALRAGPARRHDAPQECAFAFAENQGFNDEGAGGLRPLADGRGP
jgi:pimeloyl-ACP methyl ester carboxylesterase